MRNKICYVPLELSVPDIHTGYDKLAVTNCPASRIFVTASGVRNLCLWGGLETTSADFKRALAEAKDGVGAIVWENNVQTPDGRVYAIWTDVAATAALGRRCGDIMYCCDITNNSELMSLLGGKYVGQNV